MNFDLLYHDGRFVVLLGQQGEQILAILGRQYGIQIGIRAGIQGIEED